MKIRNKRTFSLFAAVLCAVISGMAIGGFLGKGMRAQAQEPQTAILKTENARIKMGGAYGTDVWYDLDFSANSIFYLVNNVPTDKGITLQYDLTEESRNGDIIGTTRMIDHLLQPAGYNAWGACHTRGVIDFQTRGAWGDPSVTYGMNVVMTYDAQTHTRTINGNAGGHPLAYGTMADVVDEYNAKDGNGLGTQSAGKEYSVYGYLDTVENARFFGLATDGGTYRAKGKYYCFDSDNNALGLTLCVDTVRDLTVFEDVTAAIGATVYVEPEEKDGNVVTGLVNCATGESVAATEQDGVWSFTMPAENITVAPVYAPKRYTVTADECLHGRLVVPEGIYAGETLTIGIVPDEGYEPETLRINGQPVADVLAEYRFTATGTDYVISATFRKIAARISVAVGLIVTPAEKRDVWYYGDDYAFTVACERGFSLPNGYKVTVGGKEAALASDGKWHVTLASENVIRAAALQTATYTVAFDTAGGRILESQHIVHGGKATQVIPVRNGYKFAGWKCESEDFDFSWIITQDITLTAQWIALDESAKKSSGCKSGASGDFAAGGLLLAAVGGLLLIKKRRSVI